MYGLDFRVCLSAPNYAVSRAGVVIRLAGGRGTRKYRVLKWVKGGPGYAAVMTCSDNKPVKKYVHRLVAEAHLGPCPIGMGVNHKDADKWNPSASNLEYMTHRQNILHSQSLGNSHKAGEEHPGAKLSAGIVREIRAIEGDDWQVSKIMAEKYGVSVMTTYKIRQGKSWKCVA